jgi:hypothetical protein
MDAPLPLQQSPLFLAALDRIGAQATQHVLPGGTVLVVTRGLRAIGKLALISRGPIRTDIASPLPMASLRGLRRALSARALVVNAETPANAAMLAQDGFVRLAPARQVAELSLAGGPENWLARMNGKWRNRLRHGLRQSLAVKRSGLPPDPQHWLFHKDTAQQAARGYRGLPPALITAMAVASPEAMHLFTVKHGPRTVAAMLFALHGCGATYLIGWSDAAGRAVSAHNLLLWHAMGDLRTLGVRQIDLGLCDDRQAPGLARFKRGSGAQVRALGGTWGESGPTAPLHAFLRMTSGKRRRAPTPPSP